MQCQFLAPLALLVDSSVGPHPMILGELSPACVCPLPLVEGWHRAWAHSFTCQNDFLHLSF